MPGNPLTRLTGQARRARRRLARATGRGYGRPLLSVIVPVYNTAEYLEECLASLLKGWAPWREIIVVDDGSTDGSRQLAKRLARADRRIRVIHQANAGLGAARNTGVAKARGRYLTFVDSDDVVPPGALATMVATLERTGSQIVIGRLYQLRDGERDYAQWQRVLHDSDHLAATVHDHPLALRNFYTPDKAFRAAFWRRHAFRFREGTLFEDQPLVTQALLAARRIDLLGMDTYVWQRRDDGTSLSQEGFYRAAACRARAQATQLTRPIVEASGDSTIIDGWLYTVMQHHLPNYLRALPDLDAEDTEAVYDLISQVVSEQEIVTTPRLDAATRTLLWLAHRGQRPAVLRLLASGFATPARWMRVLVDPVAALAPFLGDVAGAEEILAIVGDLRRQRADYDPSRFTPRVAQTIWEAGGGLRVRLDVPIAAALGRDAFTSGAAVFEMMIENPADGSTIAATVSPWDKLEPEFVPDDAAADPETESGDAEDGEVGDDAVALVDGAVAPERLPKTGSGTYPGIQAHFAAADLERLVGAVKLTGNPGRAPCPLVFRLTAHGVGAAGGADAAGRIVAEIRSAGRPRKIAHAATVPRDIGNGRTGKVNWFLEHWPHLVVEPAASGQ